MIRRIANLEDKMPQRPIPDYWKERVKELLADNHKTTAKEIFQKLQEEVEVLKNSGARKFVELSKQCPSARSIARIKKEEWEPLSGREKGKFSEFHFPETMEAGVLPWEASAPSLELLAMMDKDTNGKVRPTVDIARWYWRLSLAAPGLHGGTRYAIAVTLATHRGAGQPIPEGLEMWLAYGPWLRGKTEADQRELSARKGEYEKAASRSQNPIRRYIPRELIKPGAGPDSRMALRAMVIGTIRLNEQMEEDERGNAKG